MRYRTSRINRLTAPILLLLLLLNLGSSPASAQNETATIHGLVTDPSGAAVGNARVRLVSLDRGTEMTARTNSLGIYDIVAVQPGRYRMNAERDGFKVENVVGLTVNTQDNIEENFRLEIGSAAESITVTSDTNNINNTDGAVGMVVDRNFVQNIPLNGRSFQSLILLQPGVVTTSPQGTDYMGEYSVNGQRTTSNNFSLDGASANNGASAGFSTAQSAGSASSTTALGTTQAVISIDAMQEFRISTNTYSAEFGRQPGAQVSFTSRSGTNDYHGAAFDYLRNYAFDADSWTNNHSTPHLPRPQERQNDFGGVLGGPLTIPRLFSGRDRAFFFLSYEGLRLSTPTNSTTFYVPSDGTLNTSTAYASPEDMNLRANASSVIQPIMNAFPHPNCATQAFPGALVNSQCVDFGDGLLPFVFSTVLPSQMTSISARVDYQLRPSLRIFARYADSNSNALTMDGVFPYTSASRSRIFLLGADSTFGASLTNQIRLQYSPAHRKLLSTGQTIVGGAPINGQEGPNLNTYAGLIPSGPETSVTLNFSAHQPYLEMVSQGTQQFQPNAVDTLSWTHGRHLFKAGIDLRQTTSYLAAGVLSGNPTTYYNYGDAAQVEDNVLSSATVRNGGRQDPTYKTLGVFIQDEWRFRPRISLSLGLRYDLSPPAHISGAQQYTYTGNINQPSSLALSTLGAPLYHSTYTDLAPRFGAAFTIRNQAGHETVLRIGGGLFYDTGQAVNIGNLGDGVGLGAANTFTVTPSTGASLPPAVFPLPAESVLAAPPPPPAKGINLTYVIAPQFVPPSTVQWTTALEQAFGPGQSVSLSYVGTEGVNLSTLRIYTLSGLTNGLFGTIEEYENGAYSNYNALQAQYKRQPLHGLQVISSYTWAHAIDDASVDYNLVAPAYSVPIKGNGDHDIRQNFTTAFLYNVPTQYDRRWERAVLGYWNLDSNMLFRSGFPFEPRGPNLTDPVSGSITPTRLNWNGQNPYLKKAGIPGGRQVNPANFFVAATGTLGDAPRNFLRGFGAGEASLAAQRVFPLSESTRLQFRAEAFNFTNHPNFGTMNVTCGTSTAGQACNNPTMGQATNVLSNAKISALSSIYQMGGPRSLQFALRLEF